MFPKAFAPRPDRTVAFTMRLDFVAIDRTRGSGDQLHRLEGIRRNLRGKDLVLLIADGLSVNDVAGLCMIAQGMKEAIGVGGHTPGALRNHLAELVARIENREF